MVVMDETAEWTLDELVRRVAVVLSGDRGPAGYQRQPRTVAYATCRTSAPSAGTPASVSSTGPPAAADVAPATVRGSYASLSPSS